MTDYLAVLQGQLKSNTLTNLHKCISELGVTRPLAYNTAQNPGSTEVTEFYIDFSTARISASDDNLYASVN